MHKLLSRDASSNPQRAHCRVPAIRKLLGNDVLLLAWPRGSKGTKTAWGHLTVAAMDDPAYLAKLEHGNIGVALGEVSNGLCSLDLDSDELLAAFLESNPQIAGSLRTRGARGGNIWMRCTGSYPGTLKLKTVDGSDAGEWRSHGVQTIISGDHPSGVPYRCTVRSAPFELAAFECLVWPSEIRPPKAKSEKAVELLPSDSIEHSYTATQLHSYAENTAPQPLSNSETQAVFVRTFFEISQFVPSSRHESDGLLFAMAGAMLTWEKGQGRKATDAEKLSIFKTWWEQAQEHVDPDMDQTIFLSKWLGACLRRKFASDETPLLVAWQAAQTAPLPPAAERDYGIELHPKLKLLVAFLANLQSIQGDAPFFLSFRDAGTLLGVPHTTAFHWMELLGNPTGPFRLLTKISIGSRAARKANEYRFHPQ
jgi:hypothetical protein